MMRVAELIVKLQKLNRKDAEILVSIDEEGNDFKPIDDIVNDGKKYIIFPVG
jgi:hypothetical protein